MNERRVTLPGGGTAWVTTMADHAQAKVLRRIRLRLARYIDREGDWRADLTPEDQDAKDDLILEATALNVRTLTLRWEGVTAPNGDVLTFPEDVERMAERDIDFLFEALTTVEQETAPPNA
jgi:hypothetical protein